MRKAWSIGTSKPSNIFVLEDDSIKIIDFGVAHPN